jgi:hypothetical protein
VRGSAPYENFAHFAFFAVISDSESFNFVTLRALRGEFFSLVAALPRWIFVIIEFCHGRQRHKAGEFALARLS